MQRARIVANDGQTATAIAEDGNTIYFYREDETNQEWSRFWGVGRELDVHGPFRSETEVEEYRSELPGGWGDE